MANKGQLLGIAKRPAPKEPMILLSSARITTDRGVEDGTRGKPGRRQVTVLAQATWEAACAELMAPDLPWATRRANLLVDGIDLEGKLGDDLLIGGVILTITGETRPCEVMGKAHHGLRAALEPRWRGGAPARSASPGRWPSGLKWFCAGTSCEGGPSSSVATPVNCSASAAH